MVLLLITGLLHISRFKVEEDAGPLFCPKHVGEGYGARRAHGQLRVKQIRPLDGLGQSVMTNN